MAKLYYNMVKKGKMTIDEVPEKWRAEVQRMLDEDTAKEAAAAKEKEEVAPDLPVAQDTPVVSEPVSETESPVAESSEDSVE